MRTGSGREWLAMSLACELGNEGRRGGEQQRLTKTNRKKPSTGPRRVRVQKSEKMLPGESGMDYLARRLQILPRDEQSANNRV